METMLIWTKRIVLFPFVVIIGFFAWLTMGFSALSVNIGYWIDDFKTWLNRDKRR